MKKAFIYLFVVTMFQSCYSQKSDEDGINKCFEKFKTAITKQDGKRGIECVDQSTIAFYSDLVEKIKFFDSIQVEKENPFSKLTILKVRQLFSKDSILNLNGSKLLSALIYEGRAGNVTISYQQINNIVIMGDSARAEKYLNGKRTPFVYRFYKENNSWKINLSYLIPLYDSGIRYAISESKLPEDACILDFIWKTSGSKPLSEIWNPIIKK